MRILSIKDFSSKLRATIQATGRLGFSEDTAKTLQLYDRMNIKFAQDDNGQVYCSFPANDDSDAFKVRKSGRYFYVPTDVLFSSLGIDYKNNNVLFCLTRDTTKDDELGGTSYRMDMTQTLRKKEKKKDDNIKY